MSEHWTLVLRCGNKREQGLFEIVLWMPIVYYLAMES
jgi:hypothetical protein